MVSVNRKFGDPVGSVDRALRGFCGLCGSFSSGFCGSVDREFPEPVLSVDRKFPAFLVSVDRRGSLVAVDRHVSEVLLVWWSSFRDFCGSFL